ncbi:MAG: RDD family protein [Opitutaceae bacterium]
MTMRSKNLFVSALIALGLTLTLAVMARAQTPAPETPEPPPVSAEVSETPDAPPAVDSPETVEPTVIEDAAPEADELRRLDATSEEEVSEDDQAHSGGVTITVETSSDDAEEEASSASVGIRHRRGPAEEMPFGDHTVPEGSVVHELVSVLGNSTLNGESRRGVVSVLGDTTVNGKSGGEAVSVLGNTTINGEVDGEAVAVMGNVYLGPKAIVHGDVVAVGGQLHREDGAVINGNVQEINLFRGASMDWFKTWIYRCALLGRPLAFDSGLTWAWTLAIGVFVMYVFLALLFPRAFEKCTETFEQRPGYSLLAMLLSILLTPVLIVLLAITGIGIVLIPFVLAAIFFGTLFGKAVVHAWLGRRITRYFGGGFMSHVAVSTLVGSVIILLLYTVPFLGFFLWKVLGMLGLGIVIYTLILTTRKETAAAGPAPVAPPPVVGSAMSADELPGSSLPRAGFWLRLIATALDVIIVGLVGALTHSEAFFLLWLSIYHVVFWALRGTTIGGIVCGLKVVRLDDRPVDWIVAVVRCLGAVLSFIVIGLGFVWVAFDKGKQSWHDKIAGTVIVRAPKGVSLL